MGWQRSSGIGGAVEAEAGWPLGGDVAERIQEMHLRLLLAVREAHWFRGARHASIACTCMRACVCVHSPCPACCHKNRAPVLGNEQICGCVCVHIEQPTRRGASWKVLCRLSTILKAKKLQMPSFYLTCQSVKHNLNCQEAIYGLYFSHLLWKFIHFTVKILMCLHTECCSDPTGVIITLWYVHHRAVGLTPLNFHSQR